MEESLLGGGGGGGESSGSSTSRRQTPHVRFRRRSDAIAYGSAYQRAAALVDLAEDGVGIPEKILDQSNFQSAAKLYFIFIKFDWIWSLNFFALIVLNFFEKPLWCSKYDTHSCNDREYFFLGQLPYLTAVESLIYEAVTLIILMIHTFFPISYEGAQLYWTNLLNQLKVICIIILVADFLVYTLYLSPVAFDYLPFRAAPYIRVIFFIMNIRHLRESIIILAGMLGTYLNVLNVGFINKEQCLMLLEELNRYRTLPKISRDDYELIFDELDDSRDFKININEFDDLCNAIALKFQKEDIPSWFEGYPSIYHSSFSKKLKAFVRSPKFGYAVSFILILNLVAVIIETTLDIENNVGQKAWQELEFVFGWIYVVEMALKIYAYGFMNYWRDGQNQFDFLITWIIVIGETITFVAPSGLTFLSNGEWSLEVLSMPEILLCLRRIWTMMTTYFSISTTILMAW